jgi:hypothetical protein
MAELVFMTLRMYTTAHLSGVLHNPSHHLCLYIPLSLLGKGSVKCNRDNEYTLNKRIVRGVVFYAVHVVSKERRRLGLPRTCFSRNTASSQRIRTQQKVIVGGIVLYAVHVMSEESRRLVLPRTSCFSPSNAY